jgi:hypothetical protein
MDIAIGMIVGCFVSIISVFFTMNHILSEDRRKNLPLHYNLEILSKGKHIKGTLYLKKRRDRFNVSK